MRKLICAALAASLVLGPTAGRAEQRLQFEPIATEGASVRYNQGVATVDVRKDRGAVQITPLGVDHGRLTFDVAVLNTGAEADNFGIEDISAHAGGQTFVVLSRDQLDRMAKKRAMWAQIGVALLAGVAAAAAASSTDTYSATTFTPRGTYRTVIQTPSVAGQVAAAGAVAGGGYTIANIQSQLDATRAALANEIVQTTTIDPNESYAGRIVVDKLKKLKWPQDLTLRVTFNGEDYPFTFKVSKMR